MNIFKIEKGIRTIGFNYGLPMWFVDCGLGVSYKPEDLLRKMSSMGLRQGDWVVLRNCMDERGASVLVDALGFVGCRTEVEAQGKDATPSWFTKATRWIVYWDDRTQFNFGALRRGYDLLICKSSDLEKLLEQVGSNDQIDKGIIVNGQFDFDTVCKYRMRVYDERDT